MISETQAQDIMGSTAYGSDGEKLGSVGQLFLDDATGRPEFVTVNTGLFGMKESFVPVAQADFDGDRLTVPFTKDKVKGAPNVDVDAGHIDQAEEDELYRYYGLGQGIGDGVGEGTGHGTGFAGNVMSSDTERTLGTDLTDSDRRSTDTDEYAGGVAPEGHDTSGPTTDDAMTRSEERVDVGTTTEETGRARLRKYVTTETETHTVPVRKEKAVLETEPITDENRGAATSGPDISEEEHEVVLKEERPVVSKTTEPVERVRLGTETEVEDQTVTEEVRKEHVDVDDPDGRI